MTQTVATIGYEGTSRDAFVTALADHGVTMIVDVRAVPLSRKKGFSKNILAAFLKEHGIAYRHFRALGTPKEGRLAVKNNNIPEMHRIFAAQLATPEAQEALDEVAVLAKQEKKICLLCFERDPATCHRTLVAQALQEKALQEKHGAFAVETLYASLLSP